MSGRRWRAIRGMVGRCSDWLAARIDGTRYYPAGRHAQRVSKPLPAPAAKANCLPGRDAPQAGARIRASGHRHASSLPTWLLLIAPVALLFLAGCTAMMDNQPKLEPYEASAFFPDGLSARPVLENTVHRNAIVEPAWFNSGMQNGEPLQEVPAELVNRPSLERGQAQYDIYCSPCHGLDGYGEGMIVQRGFPPPPSLHEQRLREAPAGHYFDVISNGFGVMYGYAGRVTPADRWAIIVYIRALQLSQNAPVDDLPPEDAGRLQQGDDNE